MEPWQNDPIAAPASAAAPWQSDPIAQPPQAPDMSGVARAAQNNLAASTSKPASEDTEPKPPPTPLERANTAAGFPVDKVVNGTAQSADFPAQARGEYVKALKNGSAVDGSDWLQSVLHTV